MSSPVTPQPAPVRLAQDHIRIVQAIYGILVSLALRDLVEGIPKCLFWILHKSGEQWGAYCLLLVSICSSTLSLALRFFFISQEITDQLLYYYRNGQRFSKLWVTLVHYPMVVVQGSLFYAVCDRLTEALNRDSAPRLEGIGVAIILHATLLLTNAAWLSRFALLKARSKHQIGMWAAIYPLAIRTSIAYAIAKVKRRFLGTRASQQLVAQLHSHERAFNCEATWMTFNSLFAVFAFAMLYFYKPLTLIPAIVIFGGFTLNSILDLSLAAEFYVPKE